MSLIWHYSHATTPAGAGTDTVITSHVQIDPNHKLMAAAALGDVSVIGIGVDDDAGALDLKGLWRVYAIENAAPSDDHYVWNGYVGPQEISHGDGTDTLIPFAAGRRWNLELNELSKLAALRVISGDDGNRPAETISDRVTWLIGTVYLPVSDHGLITYDTTALDANDYRGQRAADVLNDMANIVGFNWWIKYNQANADDELAFFDPNDDSLYTSSIRISNVAADVDGSTTFAPHEDAVLRRDPQKIAAGVYLPYGGGAVYEFDLATSYEFAFQDQVAPTASVKTGAKATALADRFLLDNREQDERVIVTIQLPAATITSLKHGQLMQVKFSHLPGWGSDSAFHSARVVRMTVSPPDNKSQLLYDVLLELSPISSTASGFHQLVLSSNKGDAISANGTHQLVWRGTAGTAVSIPTPSVIQDTDGFTGVRGDMQDLPEVATWTVPVGSHGTWNVSWEKMNIGGNAWWVTAGTPPDPNPQQVPYVSVGEANGFGAEIVGAGATWTMAFRVNGEIRASALSTWPGPGTAYSNDLISLAPTPVELEDGDVCDVVAIYAGTHFYQAIYNSYGITTYGNQQGVFVMTKVSS